MHTSSNLIPTETPVNPLHFTVFPALQNLSTPKSYVPLTGCVVDHVLCNKQLSYLEKLKYILADSLSLINHNTGKQRAVSLPAITWAKMLNCSKAQVFELQKSLEEKGYFIVERTKNKLGKNKRNLLIPTMPDQVFAELSKAPTRLNADLTNYSPTVEAKRAYLDRTKLFIPVNYQLLKLIIADHNLTSFAKVSLTNFFSMWHKCHMNARNDLYQQNNSSTPDDNLNNDLSKNSFVISYRELATRFNCDKRDVSRVMIELEKFTFITRKRFFVKNDDEEDNLHDKSLWRISLTLPPALLTELEKGPIRAKSSSDYNTNNKLNTVTRHADSEVSNTTQKPKLDNQVANTDPYVLKSSQFYNKDFILNKDLDKKDATLNFFENPLSELSVSYNNSIQEKEDYVLPLQQTNTSDSVSINSLGPKDSQKSKSVKVTNKVGRPTITATKQSTDQIQGEDNTTNTEVNKNLNAKLECKTDQTKLTNTVKFSPNATLKDWYPLSPQDVDKLNSKAGREFSNNFVNELLLKLHRKYPDRTFPTKNHMLSYLTKALNRELHQSPMVNHETFRFVNNDPESIAERQREKYLAEVEYSTDTSYHSQLRRKIAAMFESKLAYQLLTQANFDYNSTNLEIDDNQAEHDLSPDEFTTQVSSEPDIFEKHLEQEQDTEFLNEPDNQSNLSQSLNVQLPDSISLTTTQQKTLENAIASIYGFTTIIYQKISVSHTRISQVGKNYVAKTFNTDNLSVKKMQVPNGRLQNIANFDELDPNSAWYKIRSQLKKQLGDHIDQSWFAKVVAEENGKTKTLTLTAISNFIRDYVRNNYQHLIIEAAKELGFDMVELISQDQVKHVA